MRSLFTPVLTVLAIALMASASSPAAQAGTLDDIGKSGEMKVGYRQTTPPMSFVDDNGRAIGFSVDLCMQIVKSVKDKLGKPDLAVEFVPVTAENRFSALKDKSIDILCGPTTKTLSRGELVDFTQLTFVTGATFLSMNDKKVDKIADLQGKKIGVVKDTTTFEALEAALKSSETQAEIVPVDSASNAVGALLDGKIDAFSADQVVLIGLVLTSKERQGHFYVSTTLYSFEPFALAVRRNDADFRLLADRTLSQIYRSGEIEEIYKTWFGPFAPKMSTALDALYRLNATPE